MSSLALSLLLDPGFRHVLLAGACDPDLALGVLDRGAEVTVSGTSEAAVAAVRRRVGENSNVRFVIGELGGDMEPASIDAILATDVLRQLPAPAIARAIPSWRRALRPDGLLCIESTQGFDAARLEALLEPLFDRVEIFSWDGVRRAARHWASASAFALALPAQRYFECTLGEPGCRLSGSGTEDWVSGILADGMSLPARWLLRGALHVDEAAHDGMVHLLFMTADPTRYFWTGFPLSSAPTELMLASDLLACVGEATFADVERAVLRARSPSGAPFGISTSAFSLKSAVKLETLTAQPEPVVGPLPAETVTEPHVRGGRQRAKQTILKSKLYDPDDYTDPVFAETRRYFESWQYLLALEKVKFSYSSVNRAWEYAQIITSVPFDQRRVLDLGTSASLAPVYLVRRLGCQVVTFDQAWDAERRALYDAAHVSHGVEIDVGDLLKPLPYPDDAFDIVTCWSVIQHLPDYSLTVSEMRRVCKPGGHICLTTDYSGKKTISGTYGSILDDAGLERLIAEFGLSFVGESDYQNVSMDDPGNLAVNGEYTFASIVLQN